MKNNLNIIVLAAGQGKRMKSALPKVLHPIAGKPMLQHVLATAQTLDPSSICVVYGHGGEQVRAQASIASSEPELHWAKQEPQLGTGHAVQQALPYLPADGVALILYGDVPLISAATLFTLVGAANENKLAWLTMTVANADGLGRILRDEHHRVKAIIEHKDASDEQRKIKEINTGFLACPVAWLSSWLPKLQNANAQGEYYLTDILAMAVADGVAVETYSPAAEWEVTGINSKHQLAQLERTYQHEIAKQLMADGTSLADPARIDVRGALTCGDGIINDVFIDVNCLFEGTVHLASSVRIGANCILKDCNIGENTEILPFSSIDGATIGKGARIGPYARVRPATTLADNTHIGNFVEVKASEIGEGSKANHLSYIGDTTIGAHVNVGAGTITCNYDGANKHRTIIEDNVQIGSDVQLIAPVTIGKGATIGAGTTVWKNAPAATLTLNRKEQTTLAGWTRPVKKN